jgi:hypothetical protein
MQQTTGMKQFAFDHIGVVTIAFALLVSGVTALATLWVTGDLPGQGRGGATSAQPRVTFNRPADRPAAFQNSTAAQPGYAASRARYYAAKEARLEAVERHGSEVAARAAQQETMRRYYAHKEQTLDAIGSGEAAGRSSNDQALNDTQPTSATYDGAVSGLIDPIALRQATQEQQVAPNYRLIDLNVLPGDDVSATTPAAPCGRHQLCDGHSGSR